MNDDRDDLTDAQRLVLKVQFGRPVAELRLAGMEFARLPLAGKIPCR